jgi:D-alanyl-D-alanine carboxypeptidase/D-alanyl-D-alanine-endopeptidase (penicillin-binding protein 4)
MLLVLSCVGQAGKLYAHELADLSKLIGPRDAVFVADSKGRILFSKNAETLLIPASTLKILTSLVAFHYLGPGYRFATEFYMDRQSNLTIKGFGDPLLISEVLSDIVDALSESTARKLESINDLVVDDSYFESPIVIPGITSSYNPYDAPNGALCVNFNSVAFERNDNGAYVSAESQTPLLPIVLPRIIHSNIAEGRINLFPHNHNKESTIYAGHLFAYFLQKKGIERRGVIRTGKVRNDKDKRIYRYVSKFSLAQIVAKMLEYSNNFIANQLLIVSGIRLFGPPGTLEKGIRAARAYARRELKCDQLKIAEGSGIAKKNRLSSIQFCKILKAFQPFRALMPKTGRQFYKTGTLDGVHTRVGYIENNDGTWYTFIVLINTPGKTPDRIMDIILNATE